MNEAIYNLLVPLIIALIASSGFWALLEKRTTKGTNLAKLVIGLAHDRIVYLGMQYIKRGWVYHDEYENLVTYLYKPYQDMDGNGSALRVMEEVAKLPLKHQTMFDEKEA